MAGALNTAATAATAASRDVTVDVARGLAIMLVVLGHNSALASAAPQFVDALFLFHVPFFFLLSGLVQRAHPMTVAVATLARRLLLPFLGAALAVGALKLLTRGGSMEHWLAGIAWGTGQTLPWSHLWFLPALFLALLATQALRNRPGGTMRWAISAAIALLAVLTVPMATGPDLSALGFSAPVGLPWSIDLLPACLLFVCVGAQLRDSPAIRASAEHPLVVAAAALLFWFSLGARVDLNLRQFTPPMLATLAATSGCVMALGLARALAAWRSVSAALACVGRHTLVIFLLHVSLQKALLGALGVEPVPMLRVLEGLATAAVAVLVSLAISMAWDWLLARERARRRRISTGEVAT